MYNLLMWLGLILSIFILIGHGLRPMGFIRAGVFLFAWAIFVFVNVKH